ncbi:hypothetical protein IGI04_034869 [Brassica rapa subsp. trilocularis]|uniref:Secreted protein n=1 Tax=Brassica rapa subsp. trilocularis TaxID=1813537 RepID=A0ABQ7LCV4_BRACM|nr:hypothetical protein IGI04_034869 [Brassica rapa subsp. trilocularis]
MTCTYLLTCLLIRSHMLCTYLLTCLLIRSHMLVTSCLLQLLVSFFMEGKCSAACAAWCVEACHQLSNLSFVFCGSKPSSEATPYDIKYPLLSSGRPVRRVFSLKVISTKFILKLEEIGKP